MKITNKSRELYDKIGKGWNTWDIQSVTAQVFLPIGIRLDLAFFAPRRNTITQNHLWDNVESFGEHSIDGSYTDITIKSHDGIYNVITSATDDELLIKVTPLTPKDNMYIGLEVGEITNRCATIRYDNNSIVFDSNGKVFTVKSLTYDTPPKWDPIIAHHITAKADKTLYFTVNSKKTAQEIDETISEKKAEWLSSTISSVGMLGDGLTAMRRSLLWNMGYDFTNNRVVTPVSRNWCRRRNGTEPDGFGDYVLFGWDTFFAGLQYGLISKDLAYSTVFSILEEETPEGMIPNVGGSNGGSRDRSEPQVGAMCVWKLYQQFNDKWFVEECFDRLLAWNRWRFNCRDFNKDGLMELASTPWEYEGEDEARKYKESNLRQAAMWESGIDNSTMWDKAIFNEEHHCLELSYVGLNALMVADCELLEKMASLLNRDAEKNELAIRRVSLAKKINEQLWDENTKCYLNKHWSGEFDSCLSLTHFYTITAGIATGERLEHLINDHLLNENEFWGEFVIPNISRNDPSFFDQDYWRGRIWAPTNFIVAQGIMRIKNFKVWDELVEKGLTQFVDCFNNKGVVGENYNAITGEAAEAGKASDRFYHWGALLVYMAVERVVNFNEWDDTVEFYNKPSWLDNINNIPVKDEKINV